MINKFQPYPNNNQPLWTLQELPTNERLGIYARQSTPQQVKLRKQSTEMQTTDLIEFAKNLGWTEDFITVFIQDLAKSGRLRIDQRPGLQNLIHLIKKGIIRAILVFLEDRLFRDETTIQVNTFIEICKQHNVLVLTPHMIYDFNNRFHIRQFRWRCEEAANFLNDQRDRLGGAARRVAEQGFYDGRPVPIGFIIDRRLQVLLEGELIPNPYYKRYRIYEPHAQIVCEIISMFAANGGRQKPLYAELCKRPVLFPEFDPSLNKDEIGTRHLKKVPGGYHLTPGGLRELLQQVAYAGIWRYRGKCYHHNHPVLADDLSAFWYGFNRLSPYTIDGEENTERGFKKRFYRNSLYHEALLKDVIEALEPEKVTGVKQMFQGTFYYELRFRPPHAEHGKVVTMLVPQLDVIFLDAFMAHIKDQSSYAHYEKLLKAHHEELVFSTTSIDEQLEEIKRQRAGLRQSLKKESLHPEVRSDLEEELAQIIWQQSELEAKQRQVDDVLEGGQLLNLQGYQQLVSETYAMWEKFTTERKISLVNAFTHRVLFAALSPHWLYVRIEWSNTAWRLDECYIWRCQGTAPEWSKEERAILREHYATTPREDLMKLLPIRTWDGIVIMGRQDLKIERVASDKKHNQWTKKFLVPRIMSYNDLLATQHVRNRGITFDRWSQAIAANWVEQLKDGYQPKTIIPDILQSDDVLELNVAALIMSIAKQ